MRKFLLVIMSVLGLTGAAGAVALSDFSDAFEVKTSAKAQYYAVSVPMAVYAGAHKPKLEDLRFFNAERAVLPHAVYRRFMDPAYEEPVERLSALKFAAADGAVVLDLGSLGRAPARFEIEWRTAGKLGGVEISADNKTWQSLVKAAEIGRQSFERGKLVSVVVPAITSRYVRLATSGEVAAVRAALPSTLTADADPQRLWMELEAERGAGGAWYLDGRGFMPFDRFKLKLQDGSRAHVRLFGRNRVSEPWQLLSDDTFYRYRFGSDTVAKDTILLRPGARRFLKLETDRPFWRGAALAAGWTPDRLIFVARGNGPYVLAFGSDAVERFDPMNEPALKNLAYPATDLVKEATVGRPVGTRSRVLLIMGFLLVMALVGVTIWVALRRGADDTDEVLSAQIDEDDGLSSAEPDASVEIPAGKADNE